MERTANIVSFSGGKDSTAMLLMMLDKGMDVDEIVFFDTGWEFPQMYAHIEKVEQYVCKPITVLKPDIPFTELMLRNHRKRGKRVEADCGYGWPYPMGRWCTSRKTSAINRYLRAKKPYRTFIGIAADEEHRCYDKNGNMKPNEYPLVEWGITEKQALEYCIERGFDWGGLYDHFDRVSCFCCPLQGLDELRELRGHYPDLWTKMLEWDYLMSLSNDIPQERFRSDAALPELEMRFRAERRQLKLGLVER